MRIRWNNLAIALLLVFGAAWGLSHRHELGVFGELLNNVGATHDPGEQLKGLAAFGILAICILALVRIALNSGDGTDRKDGNRKSDD
ncbi:MAG: hypothetical protein HY287_15070 [Planctomycetes bacterium]|nr:hypothetical protein [Planctomycetota bacterium]